METNLRSVDLNLITIFDKLMQYQNISHAANALGMTQPAVSLALKRLRALYNDVLFERKKSKMCPTAKAEAIYPMIHKMLIEFEASLPQKGTFDPENIKMDYRINIDNLDGNTHAYDFAEELIKQAPNIKLILSQKLISDPERALREREYDLLVGYKELNEEGCRRQIIREDEFVVIAKRDHPRLKNRTTMSVEEYLEESHIAFTLTEANKQQLSENIPQLSNRKVVHIAPSLQSMMHLVRITDCLGIVPRVATYNFKYEAELQCITVPFKRYYRNLYAHWHWSTEHYRSQRWIRNLLLNVVTKVNKG